MRGIRVDDVVSQCKVTEPFIVTARAELNVEGVSDDIARLEVTLARDAALLSSVGIGIANLVATLIGLRLIDAVGRRTLLFVGGTGYILTLGGCAWAFAVERFVFVPWLIFGFVGAHAMGQGESVVFRS